MIFVMTLFQGFVMLSTYERTLLFHTLHRMMDQLCSPDLTAAESKVLRPRIEDLIVKIQACEQRTPSFRGQLAGGRVS
jgi:hypothetical protein